MRSGLRLCLLFTMIILFAVGCRKEEEPTPTPTSTRKIEPPTRPPATAAVQTPTPDPTPESTFEYDWSPQLVYNIPASGEETKLDGEVTLRFDQPMDQESVSRPLTLTKAGKGGMVDGQIEWPRDDTFIFTPSDSLERDQPYELLISETAKGRNGKTLREPILLQLQTVGYLEVVETPCGFEIEISHGWPGPFLLSFDDHQREIV